MKYLVNTFLKAIFIISIINCSTTDPIELKEDTFQETELTESTTEFLFPIPTPESQKMLVEIIMSHPSKYTVTFNQYDIKSEPELLKSSQSNKEPLQVEDPKNSNIFYLNDDIEERFIHPKRRLASDFSDNQTNLIEKDELVLGKNKVVLNLDKDMEKIILSVFKIDEGDEQVGKIYIKYKISQNIEEEKYSLKDTKINFAQDKDMFNVTFSGIQQSDENMDLKNFTVLYNIKLYDSDTLYSKYENIYCYAFNNGKDEITPLFSTNIRLKGDATKENNNLKIKAPLNNKATQLLLVNARVKNGDENEQLLQYEVSDFRVEEESEERVWPDEKEEEKEKEKEKEKEEEKEKEKEKEKTEEKKEKEKEKEKSEEEQYKENRENNRTILIIILGSFGGSIIITFIGVFIYLLFFAKKDPNIEEDQDYKNVGGIVKNDEKDKENKNMNTEEGAINEEED